MRVLITGSAGFIGYHLADRLLSEGHVVVGFDCISDYYDVSLKRARHGNLMSFPKFEAVEGWLENQELACNTLERVRPDIVVHLAAQAGVRYSLENPRAYMDSNIVGSFNLLEGIRAYPVHHLLLASTSSAYGGNTLLPFREVDRAVSPLTFYAASKLAMESMAHSYSHLFKIPTTVFRFFTVYGPWGRPDMALFLFTKKILSGEPIEVFGGGAAERDFTYIDDLVDAIHRLSVLPPPAPNSGGSIGDIDTLSSMAPYRLVNVGGGRPVRLDEMIDTLEGALGVRAQRVLKPLPPGDVVRTNASTELLRALVEHVPETSIEVGIPSFVSWYRSYYSA